jgi:hypothetical protein
MGFKLPGKSIISGTSAHSSALKMKAEADAAAKMKRQAAAKMKMEAAAKMKKDSPMDKALVGKQHNLPEHLKAKIEAAPGKMKPSPAKEKKAYGGDGRTWSEADKDSKGNLNKITNEQKAYEKKKKGENPDWKKREDNTWKKRQNKINAAVGSKKVYDVIDEKKTTTRKSDGETVVKGIGAQKGKTLTTTEKSAEKAKISNQKDIVKSAKTEKKEATNKQEKIEAKNKRDEAQQEIGEIRGGRDDAKTGTVVSRLVGKARAAFNRGQLKRRAKRNSKEESSPVTMKPGRPRSKSDKEQFTKATGRAAKNIAKKLTEKKLNRKINPDTKRDGKIDRVGVKTDRAKGRADRRKGTKMKKENIRD